LLDGVINDNDLAAALDAGEIAGAALDVYTVEPPPADNPLVGRPNVILTPHLGASTVEAQEGVAVEVAPLDSEAARNLEQAAPQREMEPEASVEVLSMIPDHEAVDREMVEVVDVVDASVAESELAGSSDDGAAVDLTHLAGAVAVAAPAGRVGVGARLVVARAHPAQLPAARRADGDTGAGSASALPPSRSGLGGGWGSTEASPSTHAATRAAYFAAAPRRRQARTALQHGGGAGRASHCLTCSG